jgi:hypothetical protein
MHGATTQEVGRTRRYAFFLISIPGMHFDYDAGLVIYGFVGSQSGKM